MRRIVLASGSPRRRELLEMLGLKFDVIPDNSPECVSENLTPCEVVCELAKFKGENVASRLNDDSLIISADTVVVYNKKVIGKPKDEDDAFIMLSSLSGNTHTVYTGVYITDTQSGKSIVFSECTDVTFRKIDDDEKRAYIESGEPMDKAGAYGIQNFGALFVERINGDYFNVVGLPVCKVGKILSEEFGVKILS